jgi:predicted site-specific integrase-resolvase
MMNTYNVYNVTEFAQIVGVSVKTLQRWDRAGRLPPSRTPGHRRVYTEHDVASMFGRRVRGVDRRTIAYVRVSSRAQKADLENQRATVEQFCAAAGVAVQEWVQEIGGGLNFTRSRFLRIIDGTVAGRIACLVIAHKDRLMRFGYDLIQHLCETHDCRLVVRQNERSRPEPEMVQDVLAMVQCFSARLYGLRNYRATLQKALRDDTRA